MSPPPETGLFTYVYAVQYYCKIVKEQTDGEKVVD